jgi:hypothetical protein
MNKTSPSHELAGARKRLSERLQVLHELNARKNKIQDITAALISSGYVSLDEQAKRLGLPRATVWTIRTNKHKIGRLSAKTIQRVIANPDAPPLVLSAMRAYIQSCGSRGKARELKANKHCKRT